MRYAPKQYNKYYASLGSALHSPKSDHYRIGLLRQLSNEHLQAHRDGQRNCKARQDS